jgi:hypothetical protein
MLLTSIKPIINNNNKKKLRLKDPNTPDPNYLKFLDSKTYL